MGVSLTALRRLVVAAAATSVACSGPTAPDGGGTLLIGTDQIVTLTRGESLTLPARMNGQPARVSWATSDPRIATVTDNGVISAGSEYGEVIITATSDTGLSASVRVWVQLPESEPSTYRISLIFEDDVHPEWREAYRWAADRWQRIIRAELPPFVLTGHYDCRVQDGRGIPPMFGTETGTGCWCGRHRIPTRAFPACGVRCRDPRPSSAP